MLLRRTRWAFLLAATALVVGTVGYRWIEGWSWLDALWMAVITLTTIGFGEIHPLSPAGRWFTLGLIAGGLSIASFAVAQTTRYFIEGGFREEYAQLRRKRLMDGMKGHFIVAGFGRTGREIVADLLHAGQKVAIIDPAPATCERCTQQGLVAVHGDAASDEVLRVAGVERARGLAVATSSDAVNVFVTLSARQLNPKLKIITRVDAEATVSKAMLAGADGVVSPHTIGGTTMANGLLRPNSATFMANAFARSHPDLAMEDVEIGAAAAWHGTLGTLRLRDRHGVIVVAIRRVDARIEPAPGPEVEVGLGDVLVVVGRPEAVRDARNAAAALR